jgi:hypothetical protein
MNIAKNNHNSLCFYFNILILLLTAIILTTGPAFSASPDGDPSEDKKIYIEYLVLDWLKNDNNHPQLDEIKPLLGYVVYAEIQATYNSRIDTKNLSSFKETDSPSLPDVIYFFERIVTQATERIYQKAVLNYLTKVWVKQAGHKKRGSRGL